MEPVFILYVGSMAILGLFATNIIFKNYSANYEKDNNKKEI